MSVVTRVDDRLVHGQVVVGWARALGLTHLVLVDDEIRASAWEQELYQAGVPAGIDLEFASVAEAGAAFPRWVGDGHHTMLILADVATLVALCAVADVRQVNLGGIHQGEGRTQRLPYVYLSERELRQLAELDARGIEITAQDVPTARATALEDLVA